MPEPGVYAATKAESGHDINISSRGAESSSARAVARPGTDAFACTPEAAAHAESQGIIIADTKFEFGLLSTGSRVRDPDWSKLGCGPPAVPVARPERDESAQRLSSNQDHGTRIR